MQWLWPWKQYETVNDDDQSVMQINSVPHSESMIMAIQRQGAQPANQGESVTTPRLT